MKSIKVCLFILISLFVGFMYDSDVYAEADCDKYGCATCVYSHLDNTITYDLKSNSTGFIHLDFKYNSSFEQHVYVNGVDKSYFVDHL